MLAVDDYAKAVRRTKETEEGVWKFRRGEWFGHGHGGHDTEEEEEEIESDIEKDIVP